MFKSKNHTSQTTNHSIFFSAFFFYVEKWFKWQRWNGMYEALNYGGKYSVERNKKRERGKQKRKHMEACTKKAEPQFRPAQQPISGGGGGDEVTGVGGAVIGHASQWHRVGGRWGSSWVSSFLWVLGGQTDMAPILSNPVCQVILPAH